jgi:Arc/MetJ-type ribon-helix-helix transcriptional regulator
MAFRDREKQRQSQARHEESTDLKPIATRMSGRTRAQLDALVKLPGYSNRSDAVRAAIELLYRAKVARGAPVKK